MIVVIGGMLLGLIGAVLCNKTFPGIRFFSTAYDEQTFKDNIAKYPQFQTAIDQLHDSKPEYAGALMSVFPEARQDVESGIENMLNTNQDPAEATKSIADSINKAIEDYNVVNS